MKVNRLLLLIILTTSLRMLSEYVEYNKSFLNSSGFVVISPVLYSETNLRAFILFHNIKAIRNNYKEILVSADYSVRAVSYAYLQKCVRKTKIGCLKGKVSPRRGMRYRFHVRNTPIIKVDRCVITQNI